MPCQWCGDNHGVDQLCRRAQRGMTRRSFCFLFGAGVAGVMTTGLPAPERQLFRAKAGALGASYVVEILDTTTIEWDLSGNF